MKSLFFVFILAFSDLSFACIFQSENQSGQSPYWPSNNIEVCFTSPKPATYLDIENNLDAEYQAHFRRTVNTVKQTVEAQINARTNFNLTGFGVCPEGEQNNNRSDMPPKIRIDINGIEGNGAMAASIGPRSGGQTPNITLDSMDTQWPGGVKPDFANTPADQIPRRERTFNDQGEMSWKSLHEILHMLGIHHSEYWDSDMTGSDPDIKSVIQFGGRMDDQSVMHRSTRNFNARGQAVLSDTDVACLNHVANRTIDQFPSRSAQGNVPGSRPGLLTAPVDERPRTEPVKRAVSQ